jgi:hypothetical protein
MHLKIACLVLLLIAAMPHLAWAREMEDMPVVKLRAMDKVSARTVTFETGVGSTVKFGSLYIKIQTCRRAAPVEQPEAASFLQIWEADVSENSQWVFSGWMFSSSPGLSAMDHPIYDVWVLDCLSAKTPAGQKEQEQSLQQGEGELKEGEAPDQPKLKAGKPPAP